MFLLPGWAWLHRSVDSSARSANSRSALSWVILQAVFVRIVCGVDAGVLDLAAVAERGGALLM